MRTSLIETEQIERYLRNSEDQGEILLFEANSCLNPQLKSKALYQKKTYQLIEKYGRNLLLEEIRQVQHNVFQDPKNWSFRQKVTSYFKKK